MTNVKCHMENGSASQNLCLTAYYFLSPLPSSHFFPLYVTRHTFIPPSSTTSNDPSRIILTPTGRPHTSWPDSSGTQPVRKFSYPPSGLPFSNGMRMTLYPLRFERFHEP